MSLSKITHKRLAAYQACEYCRKNHFGCDNKTECFRCQKNNQICIRNKPIVKTRHVKINLKINKKLERLALLALCELGNS